MRNALIVAMICFIMLVIFSVSLVTQSNAKIDKLEAQVQSYQKELAQKQAVPKDDWGDSKEKADGSLETPLGTPGFGKELWYVSTVCWVPNNTTVNHLNHIYASTIEEATMIHQEYSRKQNPDGSNWWSYGLKCPMVGR